MDLILTPPASSTTIIVDLASTVDLSITPVTQPLIVYRTTIITLCKKDKGSISSGEIDYIIKILQDKSITKSPPWKLKLQKDKQIWLSSKSPEEDSILNNKLSEAKKILSQYFKIHVFRQQKI